MNKWIRPAAGVILAGLGVLWVVQGSGSKSSSGMSGHLRFTCFDGVYTESLTLEQARRPDMIVAYQMDDMPVTAAHGGPVRLYAAPMYFYKSAKWLSGITVTDHVEPGYWERNGAYDIDGWVGKSNGRNDAPTS
jgi:DMSO/TMAO reductase YedYZ molybdopterin-dependent catalytic subunit